MFETKFCKDLTFARVLLLPLHANFSRVISSVNQILRFNGFLSDFVEITFNCPRRDFAQKAKSRGGGTLVTRGYIKESTYS